MKAVWPLLLVLALAWPGMACAQGLSRSDCVSAGLKTCKPLNDFVAKLRTAVQNGDKNAVAALVAYPIGIQYKDGLEIKDKQAFVRHYDTIITKSVRDAIAGEPFVNPRKIIQFVGDAAQIWLDSAKGKLLIGTVIIE